MATFLYVILALLVFGLLVMIHELGHFLMARAFGVGIEEFSIGMGPKLFCKRGKKHDTVYSLRALPIGGYVSMVGEDEESDRPDAFHKKKVWQRTLIVIAGPLMNLILGFLLMLVVVLTTIHPATGRISLASTTIASFQEGATSPSYGLQQNDVVTHVNGTRVHTGDELVYEIMNQGYQPIDLTVRRGGEKIVLQDVIFPGQSVEGIAFGNYDFLVYAEQVSFGTVVKHTFFRSVSMVKMIFDQLGDLLTGRFGLNAVSGPIGVTEELGNAAAKGANVFLRLVVLITINLGVFNLLPIPALDGGRLLFLLVELVWRRPIDKNVEGYIHFAGIMILFGLMILISCKDIAGLFAR